MFVVESLRNRMVNMMRHRGRYGFVDVDADIVFTKSHLCLDPVVYDYLARGLNSRMTRYFWESMQDMTDSIMVTLQEMRDV
jgi:hypothetical protein